jgi:hypothetical protein
MITLIKREIQDHALFFIGSVILSTALIGLSITTLEGHRWIEIVAFDSPAGALTLLIFVFGFFAMGAIQMDTDRIRKISAFISILSVSRNRILLAKIIAGLLAILIALVPLAVTVTILLRINAPPIPLFYTMVFEIFSGTFLITLACYFIGLQAGWNSGRITPVIGGIILNCILVTLIVIKGFTLEIMVILSLFIIASLIRTWNLFMSTPL